MSNQWQEVLPGNVWNYKEEGKGAVIEGTFVEKEEHVGENDSNVYTIKTNDGQLRTLWGSSILDIRFKHLEKGELVKVEYLGTEPSQKRKGKSYHNFRVFHQKPEVVLEEVNPDDVPVEPQRTLIAEEVYD